MQIAITLLALAFLGPDNANFVRISIDEKSFFQSIGKEPVRRQLTLLLELKTKERETLLRIIELKATVANLVLYDSTFPKKNNPFEPLYKPLVGQAFALDIDQKGNIQAIKGIKELHDLIKRTDPDRVDHFRSRWNEERVRFLYGLQSFRVPENKEWKGQKRILCAISFDSTSSYRLKKRDEKEAIIEGVTTFEFLKGGPSEFPEDILLINDIKPSVAKGLEEIVYDLRNKQIKKMEQRFEIRGKYEGEWFKRKASGSFSIVTSIHLEAFNRRPKR